MAVAPTIQQINWVKTAAALARDGSQLLGELNSFLAGIALSPSVPGIALADFSGTQPGVVNVPPSMLGMDPKLFTNFLQQCQVLAQALAANNNAIPAAFVALAEYAS